MKSRRPFTLTALAVLTIAAFGSGAGASHDWNGFHWARTSNPFTLSLGDNFTTQAWDNALATASTDWSTSTVLDTEIDPGLASTKRCRPTKGRVEVCNAKYGFNGWLGVAQVWLTGGHITQGVVKMNDSYYNTATYNTMAWRNLVVCQEIGHTLGLDHQDENFDNANLGTCMDYTSSPGTNQHPNNHDYAELEDIYRHLDSTTTVGTFSSASASAVTPPTPDNETPGSWGRAVRTTNDGMPVVFVRELGDGQRIVTFVVWTVEAHRSAGR